MNFYTADVVQTYPVSLNLEKDFPQTGHHWLYIFRPDIGIELLPVLAVVAESQGFSIHDWIDWGETTSVTSPHLDHRMGVTEETYLAYCEFEKDVKLREHDGVVYPDIKTRIEV